MTVTFTVLMFIASIVGEGGLIHALAMRIVKHQTELVVENKKQENERLKLLLTKVRENASTNRKFLAEYAHLAPADVTMYRFKSIEEIRTLDELEKIEDLEWWQKIEYRVKLIAQE